MLSREALTGPIKDMNNFKIVTIHETYNERIVLMQKFSPTTDSLVVYLSDDIKNMDWLAELQKAVQMEKNVIICSQHQPINGVLGLVNCLRKESGGRRIKCLLLDRSAPNMDLNDIFYKEQLDKGLAINVYKNEQWGTYRHMLLSQKSKKTTYSYANTKITGDLSSFAWIERSPYDFSSNAVGSTKVYYSALNFRDVVVATGRIVLDDFERMRQSCLLGFEYSGVDEK